MEGFALTDHGIDFGGLNARLQQNSLQEKLTVQWIAGCLDQLREERAVA
jgi:hypothetical protein